MSDTIVLSPEERARLDELMQKWYKILEPAIKAAEESDHLTAEDFAIRICPREI